MFINTMSILGSISLIGVGLVGVIVTTLKIQGGL